MVDQQVVSRHNLTSQPEQMPTVLLVGNFFSSLLPVRGVCEDLADKLAEEGVIVIRTSHKLGRVARLLDMLRTTWARRHDYAVAQVDVYSGLAFSWAEAVTWLLRRLHKPYILTLHGGNLPLFARRWPQRVRHLLEAANSVTTPSQYLRENMALYSQSLKLLPNPLDIQTYEFRLRQQAQPCIIWLRAFHAIYNAPLAPNVLALLVQQFPDLQLIMVGPDKGDGSLQRTQQVAQELGLLGSITFPGGIPKNAVDEWMNKGDIFINTTNADNTPISVLEAMACGLCVVSTNVGGIPYLLEDEKDALLVPPGDPEAMANAIRRILSDPQLAQRLSANARLKAEQCDWSIILPEWKNLFTRVISQHTEN